MDLRFPGQWFQLETGLHYNWRRHYDPKTGRYLQPGPLGFICVSSSISFRNDLEPGKWVKIERWGNAEEARRIVSESIERLLDRRLDEAGTFVRRSVSIKSNQSSNSFASATSPAGFVVSLSMA
jgi:hypothetical protein